MSKATQVDKDGESFNQSLDLKRISAKCFCVTGIDNGVREIKC